MTASRPTILLLDVMGTLVHDPFYLEMPAFFRTTLEQLIEDKDPTAWIEFERGEIDGQTFLDRFFQDGRAYDQAGLVECMRSSYRWLDGMRELVAEQHAAGTRMIALSNYSTWYEMIEERLGLSRYLGWDFVSCNTGWRKPDLGAYRHVLAALQLPAAECVFVDDREVNCDAAREVGMRTVLYRNAEQTRSELTRHGL